MTGTICAKCGANLSPGQVRTQLSRRILQNHTLADGRIVCSRCYNPDPPSCPNSRLDGKAHKWDKARITDGGTRYRQCAGCGMVAIYGLSAEFGVIYRHMRAEITDAKPAASKEATT